MLGTPLRAYHIKCPAQTVRTEGFVAYPTELLSSGLILNWLSLMYISVCQRLIPCYPILGESITGASSF